MPATITLSDDALALLRPLFSQVEGSCEVWTDDEIATRMLVRGVMAYGQTAGREFSEMADIARAVRAGVAATS